MDVYSLRRVEDDTPLRMDDSHITLDPCVRWGNLIRTTSNLPSNYNVSHTKTNKSAPGILIETIERCLHLRARCEVDQIERVSENRRCFNDILV